MLFMFLFVRALLFCIETSSLLSTTSSLKYGVDERLKRSDLKWYLLLKELIFKSRPFLEGQKKKISTELPLIKYTRRPLGQCFTLSVKFLVSLVEIDLIVCKP